MATLFQAGTLISMLQGDYDSDITIAKVSQQGNTGLGTINGVDGEMIALDGIYYRINAQGECAIISPDVCTPFAVVSQFAPTMTFNLADISNLTHLEQQLDARLTNLNIFYMMRLDVVLSWVKIRSEACQMKPYRPMVETMPDLQQVFELHATQGTLIAVRCPTYAANLNVPGYHFHYLDTLKKTGGHVFDLTGQSARVAIQPLHELSLQLPHTDSFARVNLEQDAALATNLIEKSPVN